MLNIPSLIDEAKARKIKNYPCHVNRASAIGHPCDRYLTYSRTHWEEKQPHDIGLQYVFDLGNLYEQAFLTDLREAGLHIEEQQSAFFDKRYNLSGHIDGKLPLNGRRYPIEVKSMSPFIWEKINSAEDLRESRYPYIRGYVDQVLCYLFLHEEELGYLFLVNKVSGQVKQIEINLDYDRMEKVLQKCERINAHVSAGTLPDRIEWEEPVCGRCGFLNICYPDRDFGAGVQMIEDSELEAMLDRRSALAGVVAEYNEVDKAIKKAVNGNEQVICGHWEISGKKIFRKGYTVQDSEYWQYKIRKINQ